jgi:membrane fusion protein (multidrug efflux system)
MFLVRLPLRRLIPSGRGLLRLVLLVIVPLVAIVIGTRMYAQAGRFAETENAYVKAEIIVVSSELAGRVVEVAVRDNQEVTAGTLLFRVDPAPFEITVARARAQLDVVRTDHQSLRAEYRAAQREAEEVLEQIAFLERQFERQTRLRETGMARGDAFDEARHNVDLARRRLVSVRERATRVAASLAGNPELPVEKFPRFAEAKATLDEALADLARTVVQAPASGTVSNMRLQVGEHLEKGAPVFSLISGRPVWIEANYKETQLTHMLVGQRATVSADAYPDVEWSAVVASIAPATGAEFAVLPPQNASGNWVKVVQRIPVRIDVEQAPGQPVLRAGMTITVAVDTGQSNGLPRIVRRLVDRGFLPRFLEPSTAVAGR